MAVLAAATTLSRNATLQRRIVIGTRDALNAVMVQQPVTLTTTKRHAIISIIVIGKERQQTGAVIMAILAAST